MPEIDTLSQVELLESLIDEVLAASSATLIETAIRAAAEQIKPS